MGFLENNFGDLSEIAKEYGTPVIVYSEAILSDNVRRLQNSLPRSSNIAYSIKANPNPTILKILTHKGLMAEAASVGELSLAFRSGVKSNNLLLGGPAKKIEALNLAVSSRVAAVLVESANDLAHVKDCAKKTQRKVDILLRVNPNQLLSRSTLRMGGVPSPFGIDEDHLPKVLKMCDGTTVRYAGLFMYAGSQHFSAADIVDNTRHLCRLCQKLYANGFPAPEVLDFGGGFGVPEDASQPELDLEMLHKGLAQVYHEEIEKLIKLGLRRTIFESGRYLVSSAGIYVTRVLDIRSSHGKRFAILDGGINNLGIRQLLYRTFEPEIEIWGVKVGEMAEPTTIVGPTCTPIDVVHKEAYLPGLKIGDLVVIRNFGAYTISYSAVHFCGHPWPAEVFNMTNGTTQLVRRRAMLEEACGLGYVNI